MKSTLAESASCVAANRLWCTTVSAAALSTFRGWAEESTTGNSKKTHAFHVLIWWRWADRQTKSHGDDTDCAAVFSHISTVLCNVNISDFRMKYSAATGPPVGLECEHCGQRHQVQHTETCSHTYKMCLLIDLLLNFVNVRNLIVLSKKGFVILIILI